MMHTEVADTVLMNTEVGEVISESAKEYCNEEIIETCIQGVFAICWDKMVYQKVSEQVSGTELEILQYKRKFILHVDKWVP